MPKVNLVKNVLSGFYNTITPKGLNSDFLLKMQLNWDEILLLSATFKTAPKSKVLILDWPHGRLEAAWHLLEEWDRYLGIPEHWHLLAGEMTEQEIKADISSNLSLAMHHFLLGSPGHNFLVPLAQTNINVPDAKIYQGLIRQIYQGESLPRQKILNELVKKGYWRTSTVLEPGSWRVRGEQIDIKHPTFSGHYTITWYKSQVEKIDHIDQRSKQVSRLSLPGNNFPEQRAQLAKCFSGSLIICPSHYDTKAQPQIVYDSLSPEQVFPKIKIPSFLRLKKIRRINPVSYRRGLSLIANLISGKPAVHSDHGIGIYEGLQTRTINQQTREYLILRYAAGDRLSVPVEHAYKVTAYIGETTPLIHRLGGQTWRRIRQSAKHNAEAFAASLLITARQRQASAGRSYYIDPQIEDELNESFAFELTDDQGKAWQEVKEDLASEQAMDRLIIGDVGFGKTELAIRAACHVAANGKQVALLAPTTLLVQQHSDTFRSRLSRLSDKIGTLSRFVPRGERQRVIQRIFEGRLLIVIGTHALLSRTVNWHDLGLVIIDEEQRFGVAQKEHFKKIRASVDVLSLSATPIPRTLAMSLSGIKRLAIISSPPAGRKSIGTYVGADTDEIIEQAIKQELVRHGQVYLVAPKISQLGALHARVKRVLPKVRLAIIHGRLSPTEVASVMHQFDQQQIDVLISSTIIENGLDLPNANTIIITHATHFGLADLYQLRGRIGRRNVKGQAYFLYNQTELTGIQRQRLTAITEAARLGSGWALARRDLEIRGAGNLLGAEQSGTVNAVGVQLYLDMVRDAVDQYERKNVRRQDVDIILPLPAGLPPDYISSIKIRVDLYQKLSRARSLDELADEYQTILNRYGQAPPELVNLYHLLRLQHASAQVGITRIESRIIKPLGRQPYCKIFVSTSNLPQTLRLLNQMGNWQVKDEQLVQEITMVSTDWLKKIIEALGKKQIQN